MRMSITGRGIAVVACVLMLCGCTGVNTIHHQARAGDTVFLALGSPTGMTRQNVEAEFQPGDGSGSVDLSAHVRALFRLYPDKTSPVYLDNANGYMSWGHEPWLMTLAIDLPYPLPVGAGTVKVRCVPQDACRYPAYHPHVNDIDIGIEILPGQGQPNPLAYLGGFGTVRQLVPADLEPQPRLQLVPSANAQVLAGTRFGAAVIRLDMPVADNAGQAVPDAYIKLIPDDLTVQTNSQRQFSWKREGDVLTVYIVSPGGMTYLESAFTVVLHAPGGNVPMLFGANPAILSAEYFAPDGQGVAGPTLEVALR